jgi:class 3 adenylate cyclase
MELQTRFCTSADGTRIAYTSLGDGPPLVVLSGWGPAFEEAFEEPEIRIWYERVAHARRAVMYDRRGLGGSQREVDDLSLDAQVADLDAVVDHLELDRTDMIGFHDGAAVAVAYAARYPERVSRLVLWAPYPRGADVVSHGQAQAMVELTRQNWSLARRAIADIVYPSGPTELQRRTAGRLRRAISSEMAARYIELTTTVDVVDFLPQVKAPTLVLHRRGNRNVPSRAGRDVASLIPDARFVALEGDIADACRGDLSYLDIMMEFLDEGRPREPAPEPKETGPGDVHTILFTDMESFTALTQRLGDAKAQEVRRAHNDIVRTALSANRGSEVKHTGDGIMASFTTASSALDCGIAIQRGVAAHKAEHPDSPLGVYVGLNAGEPIAEDDPDGRVDLFGTSVDLAARICEHARPGQILASDVVRQLAAGKQFLFSDLGETELRGFEDPVKLWELRWQEQS